MRTCCILGLLVLLTAGTASAQSEFNTPRFQITAYGGGTWFDMKNINDYVGYADQLGLPASPLYKAPNFGAEIDFFLNEQVSVGIGADYVTEDADAALDGLAAGGLSHMMADMEVSFIAPRAQIKLHNLQGAWDYHFGVGAAFILGTAELSIATLGGDVTNLDLEENGVGAFGMAGASYEIAPPFTIGGQLGYRYYYAGKLDDGELNMFYSALGTREMLELDFSGVYAVVSLGMRF